MLDILHIENIAVSANGVTKRISSKDIESFNIEGIWYGENEI